MDTKKRELNKLIKAYNSLHNVINGYYMHQIETGNIELDLKNMLQKLEDTFLFHRYKIKVNNRGNSFILQKIKYNKKYIKETLINFYADDDENKSTLEIIKELKKEKLYIRETEDGLLINLGNIEELWEYNNDLKKYEL